MTDRSVRLGRRIATDPRDEGFLLRSVLPAEPPDRSYRYWWPAGWWGNQGSTPRCVAYAWLHWAEDGPVTHAPRSPGADPLARPEWVYDRAQQLDEWPGDSYDGTSVRAGAKALQELDVISEYRWAWTGEEAVRAILELGPVVVGSWWWSGMWQPDADGFVSVSGSREGGHAWVANGVNTDRGIVRCKNSWGRGWGRRGYFYLRLADFARLIEDQGEACLATEKELDHDDT